MITYNFKSFKASLSNKIWLWTQRSSAHYFKMNMNNLEDIQQKKLMAYLSKSSHSDFGKIHDFSRISSYQDFIKKINIIEDFSQIQNEVNDIKSGKKNVLYEEETLFLESTSGSTSGRKYIPYNRTLKNEFQSAIAPWICNLYEQFPKAFRGKSYWSLSPPLKVEKSIDSVIPIGAQSDTDYFKPFTAWLLRNIIAIPGHLSSIQHPKDFYISTWRHLLKNAQELSFVSIWSPYFLIELLNFLQQNKDEILDSGFSRAKRQYWAGLLSHDSIRLDMIFPNLSLVSCWDQANSALWISSLKEKLGDIPIQGKGLMSTEGVVSIAYNNSHLLSYTSHFYEFRGQSGDLFPAHQLEVDKCYEVIITTGGGLFRYNTHDLVICTGKTADIPNLQFLGRSNQYSDLVGEKINEQHLSDIFTEVRKSFSPSLILYLYPITKLEKAGYHLIIENNDPIDLDGIIDYVEQKLCSNPYYLQAIELKQLHRLSGSFFSIGISRQILSRHKEIKKIKDGDLKPPLILELDSLSGIIQP